MITPKEALALNTVDTATVEALDKYVTAALSKYDGQSICVEVCGAGITKKVRDVVMARCKAAGWNVIERSGARNDGPFWDITELRPTTAPAGSAER